MTIPILGGCACGAVRYQCNAEPIAMLNCHCKDCQRSRQSPSDASNLILNFIFLREVHYELLFNRNFSAA